MFVGEWLSWSYKKDNENDFFNPIICISTNKMEVISENLKILVKGKHYDIKFEEVINQESLVGKISPMQLSSTWVVNNTSKDINHDIGTLETSKVFSSDNLSVHNGNIAQDKIEESSLQTHKEIGNS